MDNLKEFKKQMVADSVFQQIIRTELLPGLPPIPQYDPTSDNTEDWKKATFMRQGYILCFLTLTGIDLEDIHYD